MNPEPKAKYSRAKVFFRFIIGIPVILMALVHIVILGVCATLAWFALLFTGKLPEGLFNPIRNATAYLTRTNAYFNYLTEDWPPFSFEGGFTDGDRSDADAGAGDAAGGDSRGLSTDFEEVVTGDGYAVAPDLDALGEGYGFRKVRQELDVTAFGANVITMPPGYESGSHFHERQEELYFVHSGELEMGFGDGSTHRLQAGGAARVDASTVRKTRNPSESEDVVYLVVGGKDGYVGRDGKSPRARATRGGPGF